MTRISLSYAAVGHTRVLSHHCSGLCEKLAPYASKWEKIAIGLRFKLTEIDNIKADLTNLPGSPGSYLFAMINDWSHWAPGDGRGSGDYPTLEGLKAAVRSAGLGDVPETLFLE